MIRATTFVVLSGCVCVASPGQTWPCDATGDCLEGFKCVGHRCIVDQGVCDKGSGALATNCGAAACEGQPCRLASGPRGICCSGSCVDPKDDGNCGGCGNTCPGSTCDTWSTVPGYTPPLISGACLCDASTMCPGTLTCGTLPGFTLGPGCACSTAADCLVGQDCAIPKGAVLGVCWYPP